MNPAAELWRGNFFYRELFDQRGVEARCVVFRLEPVLKDVVCGVDVTVDVGNDHLEIAAVGPGSFPGHWRILLPEKLERGWGRTWDLGAAKQPIPGLCSA